MQLDGQVNRAVIELRKGIVLTQNHGEDRRANFLNVVLAYKLLLAFGQFGLGNEGNAFFFQLHHELLIDGFHLLVLLSDFVLNGLEEVHGAPTAQLLFDFFLVGELG